MIFVLHRDKQLGEGTIGKLYLDGTFFCYTLEPTIRDVKIKGKTAIPTGLYKVALTYSPRFKKILPLVLDVPNFEGIRFHVGNYTKDTEGCILVGKGYWGATLSNSAVALKDLMWEMEKDKDNIVLIVSNSFTN